MDFSQTIKALYEERDLLNQAIATLERVHAGAHLRRRGRPPKWLTKIRTAVDENTPAQASPKRETSSKIAPRKSSPKKPLLSR